MVWGQPQASGIGNFSGVVTTYRQNALGKWVEAGSLIPTDTVPLDRFGETLLIHDDLLVVSRGGRRVQVYRWDDKDKWQLEADLSIEGNIVGGQPFALDKDSLYLSTSQGVYRYGNSTGGWAQEQRLERVSLVETDELRNYGGSIAIDGDWLWVGVGKREVYDSEGNLERIATIGVYHKETDGVFRLWQTIQTPNESADIGAHIEVDGGTAVVAGWSSNVYLFRLNAITGSWQEAKAFDYESVTKIDLGGERLAVLSNHLESAKNVLISIGSP